MASGCVKILRNKRGARSRQRRIVPPCLPRRCSWARWRCSSCLPVVGGAYLGNWLDGLREGYSYRWTMSLLFAGVFIGAMNVYLYIQRH